MKSYNLKPNRLAPAFMTALAVVISGLPFPVTAQAKDIRLIVQITVDGLRGDLLDRYEPSLGAGGFRRLTEGGVWYTDAHHLHANTETIVGHATLATGAHPSEHGMIGNAWFDRKSGQLGYNIEDPDFPMLVSPGFEGDVDQVDPAQAVSRTSGRSPRNLLATTFGDELLKANNGRSKVLSISGKDRSAVAMAGHFGKAFWMSTATGAFETSAFYYDSYPDWVTDWNAGRPADAAIGTEWTLEDPVESYLLAENDDRPYETDLKGFGRTFPHRFGPPADGLYYTQVLLSPLGDRLVADLATAAILAEDLGRDNYPDFLSLSFSGVDAANHFFGPSSLENEEMVRRLDKTLADFFGFLDAEVGADKVLYVLSADHGMPEFAEFMNDRGFETARNWPKTLQEELNAEMAELFGVSAAVKAFFRPYVYLDYEAIAAAGADLRAVETRIAESLMSRAGIAIAMPRVPLPDQRGNFFEAPIRHNFHPSRSGDIYVVQSPYAFLFDKGAVSVMHGTPWRFDTHVPVLFAGPGVEPAKIHRRVATTDVAVTLSRMFGTTIPSGASGTVLVEALPME